MTTTPANPARPNASPSSRCPAPPTPSSISTRPPSASTKPPARAPHLVCLPELFRAQYFCQREDHALFGLAEPIPGPSTDTLTRVCRETGVVLVASLFERRAPGLYHNTAVTIEKDGTIADIYRKMHIPDDPLYYEKFYFTPGDLGFKSTANHARPHRHSRLLGPVVPRRRPPHRPPRSRNPLLPHRHRLAPL